MISHPKFCAEEKVWEWGEGVSRGRGAVASSGLKYSRDCDSTRTGANRTVVSASPVVCEERKVLPSLGA